jgi:hypothetical protein
VFDGKWIRRIVLAIRQSLQLENPVAASAIEIAAENDGAQFKRAFLVREGKADNAPEELIFAEGCREDRGWRGDCIGGRQRSKVGLPDIEIKVPMTHRVNALFCAVATARAQMIGSNVGLGSAEIEFEPA